MVSITYYGHSCFMAEIGKYKILFDPFITGNEKAKGIDIKSLKPDYIFVSHAHQDHVLDVEVIAKNSGATLVSNYEITQYFAQKGVDKGIGLNHGGGVTLPFGTVKYTIAHHSSSFADGTYGGQPGGFVVTYDSGAFYYSGDTALTMDMKLIGERYKPDFALLCIGDVFTMDATDAAKAAEYVGVKRVIGMHFDTFPPIVVDHDKAVRVFRDAGRDLTLMEIGETLDMSAKIARAV